MDVYADIVYCIDLTSSMTPVINKVKETARRFHSDLQKKMKENYQRNIKKLRIKVIGFRDAYCDVEEAFEQSQFFHLPEDTDKFERFLKSLEAKGGSGAASNSLEALALAMKSDWCQAENYPIVKRHIIILFTNASAHPLEKAAKIIADHYPDGLPKSYVELVDWWNRRGDLGDGSCAGMDQAAKRMGIFAPEDCEPWDMIEDDFNNCLVSYIDSGNISYQRFMKAINECYM